MASLHEEIWQRICRQRTVSKKFYEDCGDSYLSQLQQIKTNCEEPLVLGKHFLSLLTY